MADITVIRGDDNTINLTISDSNGAVNITGMTVFFTVKNVSDINKTTANCALIKKDVTAHTDPTHGITEVVLNSTDTDLSEGTYYWDLQLKTAGGAISSTTRGNFIVTTDVTRRTS